MPCLRNQIKGFSLIELFFSLSLLAILTVLAISSMDTLSARNELQSIQDELKSLIAFARLKALALNQSVYLIPLEGMSWSKGIVLAYWDKKNQRFIHFHQWPWQHPKWQLTWAGVQTKKEQLVFAPYPRHAMSNGRWIIRNKDSKEEAVILLNRLGRVRSTAL